MFYVWLIGGIVLIAIGVVCVGGAMLPREHRATVWIHLNQLPHEVYRAIRVVGDAPTWRKSLSKVEVHEGAPNAPLVWTETSSHGAMRMRCVSAEPQEIVTRIDDDTLPFGGTWTFQLTPESGGTHLRITEDGFVKPPPFRFLAKFVFGHSTTMKQYCRDLAAKFGESASIES